VFVEYAKASPEDLLVQISVHNRGPEPASLHVLPTLWFRNRWSWDAAASKSAIELAAGRRGQTVVRATDSNLGEFHLYCDGDVPVLFTENESNTERVFGVPNRSPYVKDGINNFVVHGQQGAVNPGRKGTKA